MRLLGRIAALVVPFALCSLLVAQNSQSSRKHDAPQPTASRGGSGGNSHPANPAPRSFVTQPLKSDSQQHHNPPQYHYSGGYVYSPYYYGAYNSYAPYAAPASAPTIYLNGGPTATDRLLANGGTFTLVDSAPGEVPPQDRPQPAPAASAGDSANGNYPSTGVGTPLPTTFAGDASRIPEMNSPSVDENPAILVYADGHRMEIRNYAVFAGSVIVLGGERRKIPLGLLDLKATLAANEEAGCTFRIPAVSSSQ